jgi:hypothetical protein
MPADYLFGTDQPDPQGAWLLENIPDDLKNAFDAVLKKDLRSENGVPTGAVDLSRNNRRFEEKQADGSWAEPFSRWNIDVEKLGGLTGSEYAQKTHSHTLAQAGGGKLENKKQLAVEPQSLSSMEIMRAKENLNLGSAANFNAGSGLGELVPRDFVYLINDIDAMLGPINGAIAFLGVLTPQYIGYFNAQQQLVNYAGNNPFERIDVITVAPSDYMSFFFPEAIGVGNYFVHVTIHHQVGPDGDWSARIPIVRYGNSNFAFQIKDLTDTVVNDCAFSLAYYRIF